MIDAFKTTGTSPPEELLTPDELAARLKVKVTWIREKTRQRSDDPLPFIRLGRYVRFRWSEIEAWLNQKKS